MKKKILEKADEKSWFEIVFPKTDFPFKQVLSMFVIYYIITWLIKTIQITNPGNIAQISISIVTLWVIFSWIVWLLRDTDIVEWEKIKWKKKYK